MGGTASHYSESNSHAGQDGRGGREHQNAVEKVMIYDEQTSSEAEDIAEYNSRMDMEDEGGKERVESRKERQIGGAAGNTRQGNGPEGMGGAGMWGGGRPHVERPTGTAGEEGADVERPTGTAGEERAGMCGGGRPHVERPTGADGEEGAGTQGGERPQVESPAEEEMKIEREAAKEAVKEAMRKGGKTEKEVYEDMSLRFKQRREGACAEGFRLAMVGIDDEFEDKVPGLKETKPPFMSWAGQREGRSTVLEVGTGGGAEGAGREHKGPGQEEGEGEDGGKGAAARAGGLRAAVAMEVCCGEGGTTATATRRGVSFGTPTDKRMGEDQDISKREVRVRILGEFVDSGASVLIYEPECTPYNDGYTLENARRMYPETYREVLRERMDKWDDTFLPLLEEFAELKERLAKSGKQIRIMMEQSGRTTLLREDYMGSPRFRRVAVRLGLGTVWFTQCKWVEKRYRKETVWYTDIDERYFWEFTSCDCPYHSDPLKGEAEDGSGRTRCAAAAAYPEGMQDATVSVAVAVHSDLGEEEQARAKGEGKVEEIRPSEPADRVLGIGSEEDEMEFQAEVMPAIERSTLSGVEKRIFEDVFRRFFDVFRKSTALWPAEGFTGTFALMNPQATPPKRAGGSVKLEHREFVRKHIEELIEAGVVRKSTDQTNPYVSGLVTAPKKDGEGNMTDVRVCVNFIPLNKLLKAGGYVFANIDEVLAKVAGAKYKTTMDCWSGYHQIKLDAHAQRMTQFYMPGMGLFVYTALPFGVKPASEIFCAAMEVFFEGMIGKGVDFIIDDLCVTAESFGEHVERVTKVLERCRKHGLSLKPKKLQICVKDLESMGFTIAGTRLKMQEGKSAAITNWPIPSSTKELQLRSSSPPST